MSRIAAVSAVALLLFAYAALAADPDVKAAARKVLEKNKEAIVTVKMVVSTRYVYGGRESHKQERKAEIVGTLLDPSGLAVVSNTAVDPYSDMMDMSMDMGGENMQIKPESNITDIKIVLADGTEIPAEFSLKDKDLDLAFVRPKEKLEKPCPCVNFTKTAEPELLEDVITIGRMGRELNRVNSMGLGIVQAVVKKPRTFYVCDLASGFTGMGCPVFNSKGETLGLCVIRKNPVKGSGFDMMGGMKPVVLPSEDLMEIAKQALTAKTADAAPVDGKGAAK